MRKSYPVGGDTIRIGEESANERPKEHDDKEIPDEEDNKRKK
jgi:hypothetical protein